MKISRRAGRVAALFLSFSLAVSMLNGCGKKGTALLEEVQKAILEKKKESTEETSQSLKQEPSQTPAPNEASSDAKEETTEIAKEASEEDSKFNKQVSQRLEEYNAKIDKSIHSQENQMDYCRRDVQADFLQTLQLYYLSMDNYTTTESTIGDLITTTVADSICNEVAGGSSTVSAALVTAAEGIHAGDSPGEIVTNTFVDAMEELPNEITARVYDYLLGETVFKALDVLDALTTNRQTQHLANLVDVDIRNDIRELSHICSKEEFTLSDCYMGMALADSILQKSYEIEQVLGVNAGSGAWRPFYQKDENGKQYGNYITTDFNELAFHILEIERLQRCKDILNGLSYVEKASGEDVAAAFNTPSTWSNFSSLDFAVGMEDYIKSMYDWDDAMVRSQGTKFWNAADALLGNAVTNIFVEHYNQQEGRFADALAEFNSEARAAWLKQYIPLKCDLMHFNAYTSFNGAGVVNTFGGGDEIDQAIAMAYLKAQLGKDVSLDAFMELHGDRLSKLYRDLYALFESTRILYDTYYLAMADSESNTNFLNQYLFALKTLDKVIQLCPEPAEENKLPVEYTCTNEFCVKIAEASKKLMDFYIENIEERSDLAVKFGVNVPTDEGVPVTCTLYTKSPSNGCTETYLFAGILHREGFEDIKGYGHRDDKRISTLKTRNCFWIQDRNSKASGHVTFNYSRRDVMDVDLISDELLLLMKLVHSWTACWEMQTNPNPILVGIPQLFSLNADTLRQEKEEYAIAKAEEKKRYEERRKPFLELQARVEAGEDVIWTKPEKLEQLFIEKYVKVKGYKDLLKWNYKGIADEPEGFGTLTRTQPLTRREYEMNGNSFLEYQSIYKTGGGKELVIKITRCWDYCVYDNYDDIYTFDFFIPEFHYNGVSPIIDSPVSSLDPEIFTILE